MEVAGLKHHGKSGHNTSMIAERLVAAPEPENMILGCGKQASRKAASQEECNTNIEACRDFCSPAATSIVSDVIAKTSA